MHVCLSSSLEIIGRTEIGRKPVFGSEAGPDLWTGVTRASLRAEWQMSDWMLQVRTLVRLSRIAGKMSFSNGALIPSRPVATFVGNDLINLSEELTSKWDFKVCSRWFSVVYKAHNVWAGRSSRLIIVYNRWRYRDEMIDPEKPSSRLALILIYHWD